MSFLNKRVEDSIKQAKLLAQMSELSYRALNGTRQTRSNFINNDLKEQADTDKPAVGSLTSEMIAQYKREEEEKNKYVDPKSGDEFLYAPTGMTIARARCAMRGRDVRSGGFAIGWVVR